jgi:hypothetical protein
MFSKMMAAASAAAGLPDALLTVANKMDEDDEQANELDPSSVVRPAEAMSIGELVNQRAQQAGEVFRNPGEYLMGAVQPQIDALRDSIRDPAEYAEMRLQMALDGRLDAQEAARARRMREMQAFQQQGLSNYSSGQRATQLPTGYFNDAQRGLF